VLFVFISAIRGNLFSSVREGAKRSSEAWRYAPAPFVVTFFQNFKLLRKT
jgi:hypothetical protein